MLTCVYHPIDAMRVVEHEQAMHLQKTGVWFDCPAKAKAYRAKLEEEIKQEDEAKANPPKAKFKGKRR